MLSAFSRPGAPVPSHGRADPVRRRAPRRPHRRPDHLLPQGLHPAHDAVPRPLRLLHLRTRRRPGSNRRTCPWRGSSRRPGGCRLRQPRGPLHARRGAGGALPVAREWLDHHGFASTVEYLVHAGRAGARGDRPASPRQRRPWATTSCWRCGPSHLRRDDGRDPRRPARRTGRAAPRGARQDPRTPARDPPRRGAARVPSTTGILVGHRRDGRGAAEALLPWPTRTPARPRPGVIVQNFRPKPGTAMHRHPEASHDDLLRAWRWPGCCSPATSGSRPHRTSPNRRPWAA